MKGGGGPEGDEHLQRPGGDARKFIPVTENTFSGAEEPRVKSGQMRPGELAGDNCVGPASRLRMLAFILRASHARSWIRKVPSHGGTEHGRTMANQTDGDG